MLATKFNSAKLLVIFAVCLFTLTSVGEAKNGDSQPSRRVGSTHRDTPLVIDVAHDPGAEGRAAIIRRINQNVKKFFYGATCSLGALGAGIASVGTYRLIHPPDDLPNQGETENNYYSYYQIDRAREITSGSFLALGLGTLCVAGAINRVAPSLTSMYPRSLRFLAGL